jgi:ATP-dependent helicase/nuclease subunit B
LLEKRGMSDLVMARNAMLDHVSAGWAKHPPEFPIIAAGISTTAPAVLNLLRTILTVPKGAVVLSGLDFAMPDAHWDRLHPEVEEGGAAPFRQKPLERHPQYALRTMLNGLSMQRGDAKPWMSAVSVTHPSRSQLASAIFVPAEFSSQWRDSKLPKQAFDNIAAYVLPNPAAEAKTIALLMREMLEHSAKTAALVTPDRALAERVSVQLSRWGISADDSAGQSLLLKPQGSLTLALAQAAASEWAPVQLISLLGHPLIANESKEERLAWLDQVRLLDLLLRGPRPAPGLAGIRDRMAAAKNEGLLAWWDDFAAQVQPLQDAISAPHIGSIPMNSLLAAIMSVLSGLCGEKIWHGAEGRALSDRLTAWLQTAANGPQLYHAENFPDLVQTMLADIRIRPSYGGHPRLFIWGALEARLQTADRVILAGLNEGSWPVGLVPDPWLPPGMRQKLGLPGREWQTGLSAMDFAGAFSAEQLVLTRAERDATAPTIASRFWLRLEALAGGTLPSTLNGVNYTELAQHIDQPATSVRIDPPAPRPPAAMRPKGISVTDVDLLQVDPFAYYAKHVLRLSALDRLDMPPGPAWRGTQIHTLLENWVQLADYNIKSLIASTNAFLQDPAIPAQLRQLWGPKLRSAMQWAAITTQGNRAEGRVPLIIEVKKTIDTAGIKLTGKPDRIDRLADGRIAIVDYKTGSSQPKAGAREHGFALQLGLLAHMARAGAFSEQELIAETLEYWLLGAKGKDLGSFGTIDHPYGKTFHKNGKVEAKYSHMIPDNFADFAAQRLTEVAQRWLLGDAPFVAKVRPQYAVNSDYDHLMRYLEWYGRSDAATDADDSV